MVTFKDVNIKEKKEAKASFFIEQVSEIVAYSVRGVGA